MLGLAGCSKSLLAYNIINLVWKFISYFKRHLHALKELTEDIGVLACGRAVR